MPANHSNKPCSKCGIAKSADEFSLKRAKTGLRDSRCKSCVREISRQWYGQNKKRRADSARAWVSANNDRYNARRRARRAEKSKPETKKAPFDKKKWAADNKERIAGYRRKWLENNPVAAMADRVRRRLNEAFNGVGAKRKRKAQEILGCTWEEFALHIESGFVDGMTWDNRNEWHIDHIVPIATASTESDVIRLNHFTNLRPLWAADNRKKWKFTS